MELVYDISTEKNSAAGVLLTAFLTPLFVIIQWLQLGALHRRSTATPSCHGSTKKLFQIHHECSLLPVKFFSPGIGSHESHSPDPCIADGKWGVFTPHECKMWTLMWAKILSLFHTSRSHFCFHWCKADRKPLADALEKGAFLTALPSLFPSTYGHYLTYLIKSQNHRIIE